MAVQEQYYQDASKHDHSSSAYNFYIIQKVQFQINTWIN